MKQNRPSYGYQSALKRNAGKRRRHLAGWKTRNKTPGLVITITMPRAKGGFRPGDGIDPAKMAATEGAEVSVAEFDPSSITLTQILDTFRYLENPHSRVFAGLFETSTDAKADAAEEGAPKALAPVISGFAEPGSKIAVTFSDELGIPQSQVTVYSDDKGHWIAPRGGGAYLSETQSIQLEITPPLWSGETASERYYVSFPADALQAQGANRPAEGGGLLGVVIQPERAPETDRGPGEPKW